MTASLVIQRQQGRLTWAKDFAEFRVTPLWPKPIAIVPLSEADALRPGDVLFWEWVKANPDKAGVVPPQPLVIAAPTVEIAEPDEVEERDEIHITSDTAGPLCLPDGRAVEVGEGLVVLSIGRFAELIEKARFPGGATDI